MFKSKAAILVCAMAISGVASADLVNPISYTAPPGEVGKFSYFDDTGTQLTDGILGGDDLAADLGNGNAYEWIGWLTVDPVINFNFDSAVAISQILIGFNHRENGGVYLPKKVTVNDKSFQLEGSEISDLKRGVIKFNGPFYGPIINITLEDYDSRNRWIFVDEIQFISSQIITTLSASVGRITSQSGSITCTNLTTGNAKILKVVKGTTSWDCEKSGLIVNRGDKVQIKATVNGIAK